MKAVITSILCAAAFVAASPAAAGLLRYKISGVDVNAGGEREYGAFYINADPTPDQIDPRYGFAIDAVPGVYRYGNDVAIGPQDVSFYLDSYDGGLQASELLEFTGPQLFTVDMDDLDHPHLLTGSFTLFDAFSGSPINLDVAAVPEPMTWAMMVLGFGAVGYAVRRRRAGIGAIIPARARRSA